jgi:spore germination protein GerM
MKRTPLLRAATLVLLVALLAALPVMGGCKKETPETPNATNEAESPETTEEPVTPAEPAEVPATPAASDGSEPAAATPNAPTTMTVRLTWVEAGENALGVERAVPYSKAVATAAMTALLAGPTPQEQTTWPAISTAIPVGTKLLGLTVDSGIAKVNLSKEFESGGGTFSVTARLAQVVYTLDQFPTINAVEFYIEGAKVSLFSSEGLILDKPQTIKDYEHLLPMDA